MDFLFYSTGDQNGQKAHCVLSSHQALLILVMFSKLISQAFINCRSTNDPVWHNVAGITFYSFELCLETRWRLRQKAFQKSLRQRGCFRSSHYAANWHRSKIFGDFFLHRLPLFFLSLSLFLNTLCCVSGTLDCAMFSAFISSSFWSLLFSVHA